VAFAEKLFPTESTRTVFTFDGVAENAPVALQKTSAMNVSLFISKNR
jgi:hypothetical protein